MMTETEIGMKYINDVNNDMIRGITFDLAEVKAEIDGQGSYEFNRILKSFENEEDSLYIEISNADDNNKFDVSINVESLNINMGESQTLYERNSTQDTLFEAIIIAQCYLEEYIA